jgi:hypothetical protein
MSMNNSIKPGDRVRLTRFLRITDYRPGDTGRVSHGPIPSGTGSAYFLVRMDGDKSNLPGVVLSHDEVELDANPTATGPR